MVPGVQRIAGVRADVRRRRELAPGRDGVSPSIMTRSAATVRSKGDIDSAASRISLGWRCSSHSNAASSRCTAHRPSGVITGLSASPVTAPKPASNATIPPSRLSPARPARRIAAAGTKSRFLVFQDREQR
jgi:hypothetical protein